MDSARVHLLRELLATTGWVERSREFARSLRRSTTAPGSLLLVGTPAEEPWHLAAHLDDEARFSGRPELMPTLVRWSPPSDAAAHLRIGIERLEAARRGETLLVVAPDAAPVPLLERLSDARRTGVTILSMDEGDEDLADLAHDRIVVPRLEVPPALEAPGRGIGHPETVSLDTIQHLVSVAAGEDDAPPSARNRLSRLLERISGPAPER